MSTTGFTELPDLASRDPGRQRRARPTTSSSPPRENLIRPEPPAAVHTFGHKGKEYDGWETRRRREPGHDWAIVRLGVPGVVHGVVVDTAHFPATTRRTSRSRRPWSRATRPPPSWRRLSWEPILARSPAHRRRPPTATPSPTTGSGPTCG